MIEQLLNSEIGAQLPVVTLFLVGMIIIVVLYSRNTSNLMSWFSGEMKEQRESQRATMGMVVEHMEKSDKRYDSVAESLKGVQGVLESLVDRVGGSRRDL